MSKARGLADLGNAYSDGALSNRNMLINSDMRIAQRGTSKSITQNVPSYLIDRFYVDSTTPATLTYAQSSDAPGDFVNSLGITVNTSGTTAAGQYAWVRQSIEGYNFAHLNFGTANAKTFTLSFWVKSSVTGILGGWFGAALNNRFQSFTYTILSANTWEYKTVTISGDTAGTWNNTNGVGLQVSWSLSCGTTFRGATGSWSSSIFLGATGQTNITETAGATFNITGIQLEVGDTATPFEHRSVGQELALCQRYYAKLGPSGTYTRFGMGFSIATTNCDFVVNLPTSMRIAGGTLSTSGPTTFAVYHSAGTVAACSAITVDSSGVSNDIILINAVTSGLTAGAVGVLIARNNVNTYLAVDAEL
jgi:hypothetical protein